MSDPATALSGLRIAIGTGALLSPSLTAKLFGLSVDTSPQSAYMARLFGVRDIVLGVGTLMATGEERTRWLQFGVACDAADTLSAVLEGKAGRIPSMTTVLGGATAASATALGVMALQSGDQAAV